MKLGEIMSMKFYFAPLEGITGHIYRNTYHRFFNSDNISKFFSPFVVAKHMETYKTREIKDILLEHNKEYTLIPQILTNCSEDFIYTAKKIQTMGYDEINLNLGCPAGTVVSKGKGAGFLKNPEALNLFFADIFREMNMKISVKTRLGIENPEEFYELIHIFNQYPIHELIIHPRVQKDFYKNNPRHEVFQDALLQCKMPLCYNGDIFSVKDYQSILSQCKDLDRIMLGRGLLRNPGLIYEIQTGNKLDKESLLQFHDALVEEYGKELSGERNVLFKMKELWIYMGCSFTEPEKYLKKIKKAEGITEYKQIVDMLFREQEMV